MKDQALTKQHHDLARLSKKYENTESQLNQEKDQVKRSEEEQTKLSNEIKNLQNIINQAYQEYESKKQEYQKVINERDILGTQLIRRNDELALLYEKIKI